MPDSGVADSIVPLDDPAAERQRLLTRIRGFTSLGPSAAAYKGYAGEVAACLNSSDTKIKQTACSALAELGEAGAPYVGEVLKLLGPQEPRDVRRQALETLGACGAASPQLSELANVLRLELQKKELQAPAARAVGQLGLAGDFSSELARLASGPSPHVRAAALSALGTLGPEAAAHAKLVATRMAEPALRAEALLILAQTGEAGAKYLDEVADCLRDSDFACREAAAVALRSLGQFAGEKHERTVQKALDLLDSRDEHMKAAGISALGFLGEKLAGPHAQRVATFLIYTVPEEVAPKSVEPKKETEVPYSHFDLYMITVFGLPKKEPNKKEEIEALPPTPEPQAPPGPAVLRKPNCAAALALARLGNPGHEFAGTIGKLAVSSGDLEMRLACLEALGEMGGRGVLAESMLKCLKDEEPAIRASALATLGTLAQHGVEVEDALAKKMIDLLADSDVNVACAAALSLADLGGAHAVLASAKVAQLLRKPQQTPVLVALQALGTMASQGAVVVTLTISGIDYSFMRSFKSILKDFHACIQEVISSEVDGAKVFVECSAAGYTGAYVKAVIMQDGIEDASSLQGKLDGQKLGDSLKRKLASVEDIGRVVLGERFGADDVVIACQGGAHVQQVAKLMEDSDPSIRQACLECLGAMARAHAEAAVGIAGRASARLEDEEAEVRAAAARLLAGLGQEGASEAASIARLLQDAFVGVRQAARESLGRMAEAGFSLPADVKANLEEASKDDQH